MNDEYFMREAIRLAREGMNAGKGGPLGSIIVKDGQIVGRGSNEVTSTNDPTAHAEVVAIRDACRNLNTFQLDGCTLYASCEPCPMCLGAIYWARPERIVYGAFHSDAAGAGFDDQFIYQEIDKPREQRSIPMSQALRDEANTVFDEWKVKTDKTKY
ncbi:tRNA-specific adenosine deaminase [Rudanella paleaurantiibacter]|uniref:tRNA-specific adenosine deaminase n=1 Tax=Rudanella paleaurantiibacter TaxID=2614655 RepID=A0A7J5TYU5_9BACT|nr:nucleoside deaminase [Rudanella paleaurantiibacter]KAB7730284.1 tRNA-specific adenosine deaminase [Rudanella paleaurantiibacter]